MPQSETFNIDCMEYMKTLPDESFDLAISDPPYFSGPEKREFYGQKLSSRGVRRVDYEKIETWQIPDDSFYKELCRVSKNQIIFGINYFKFSDVPAGRIIWDKVNGASSFSDCEIASCSMISSVRIFRYMWNGMMQGKSISEGYIAQGDKSKNEKRIHPTQKPVELGRYLIRTFSNPGDTILDNACGSGSFLVAAALENRKFIGIEKNQNALLHKKKVIDYIKVCNDRIKAISKPDMDAITKYGLFANATPTLTVAE